MSLAGLRRSAQKMNGGGKSKGKGGFYANWSPPSFDKIVGDVTPQEAPHVAEPIVLIEGEYADPYNLDKVTGQPETQAAFHYRYHRYTSMYQGKKQFRMMSCLRGPDSHNPKQCVVCLLTDNKELDEKNFGARSGWVFNIAHLVPYHVQPLMKGNQIQMKKDNSGPIMVDRECRHGTIGQRVYARKMNKPCEGCQQQVQAKLGSHRYWQVGKGHLDALIDFNDKTLSKVCFYTNTGIIQIGFCCSRCSTRSMDIAASGYTNEQIKNFTETPQRCTKCGHAGLPTPEYESGYVEGGYSKIQGFQMPNGPDGQPLKARPLNLYDVVLWVQREGESTDSKPVVTRWCRLTKFATQNGDVDITAYVNETIVPNPFDFDDLFTIDTERQAKFLDRANPYAAATQQQNFARYGQLPAGGYAGPTMPPPQPTFGAPAMPGFNPQQHPAQQGFPPGVAMPPPQQPQYAPQGYPQQPPQGYPQQMPQQEQAPIAAPYPQQQPFPPPNQPTQAQPAQPGGMPVIPPPGRPNW